MKETLLVVEGPYAIPYDKGKRGVGKFILGSHGRDFWLNAGVDRIAKKQGCYVFAIRAGKGYRPWYVGKSTRSLDSECFQPHKLNHYNRALILSGAGTPVLFFVVPSGTRKKVAKRVIDDLEVHLIQTALYRNPRIGNVSNTKSLPKWGIAGIIRGGKGKRSTRSQKFKTMMRM